MKFVKLSLSACIALSALSSVAMAQPLEEAIKNVDVSGMLRYRYTDDRYENRNFLKDSSDRGSAAHQWRAEATLKTAPMNNVAVALNLGYHNAEQTVNHGKNQDGTGNGLGAGGDGKFGVREFKAIITPDSTNTTITAGKMILPTPLNDTLDDRGTGILLTNSDINHWNFVAGVFDSWSPDDAGTDFSGYLSSSKNQSFAKNLYTIAALANYDVSYGNWGFQAWLFKADDMIESASFLELGFTSDHFHAKGQYAFAKLDDGKDSALNAYHTYKVQDSNDLYSIEGGVRFHTHNVPFAFKVGYIGNTQDGYAVSIDNEGSFQKTGNLWFENGATGVSFSVLSTAVGQSMAPSNGSNELSVIYANLNYDILENLNVGIDYVNGKNELTRKIDNKNKTEKIDFQEISPNIKWQYSEKLQLSAYYAMLKTDNPDSKVKNTDDETRNRLRLQALYSF